MTLPTLEQTMMYVVGLMLIYLAIKKRYEPALLLPMGFGAILVNLPGSGVLSQEVQGIGVVNGIIEFLYKAGIEYAEVFPILLFIGIGAMIDFTPLLQRPVLFVFGIAAQTGIFVAIGISMLLGFDLREAVSIGIIGAADGPTAILVAETLDSKYIGAITVAAYSYMALVPIIQPVTIKAITSKEERRITMSYAGKPVSRRLKILFPIAVTIAAGLVAPMSVALVGCLMFGNLIKECGVLETLSKTAQDALTNLITLLLGLSISYNMQAEKFLRKETLLIMAIGLFAFVFDTIGGVCIAKLMNLFMKEKINPMVGAAGISAFPMSSRAIQKLAQEEKPGNVILMHAVGANVAGQIGSVLIGGLILSIFGKFVV